MVARELPRMKSRRLKSWVSCGGVGFGFILAIAQT
jgi:hypothetical protein